MTTGIEKEINEIKKIALKALEKSNSNEKDIIFIKTSVEDRRGSYELLDKKMTILSRDFVSIQLTVTKIEQTALTLLRLLQYNLPSR